MQSYLFLPGDFVRFWFLEAPKGILAYCVSLNASFFRFFSVPLLLRTFFRPLKNEYREGLIAFSIFLGILIKSAFILTALIIFFVLIVLEIAIFLGFLAFPFLTLATLFYK